MCPPPAETDEARRNAPTAQLLPPLSLGAFAALTARSALVICNDSGVSHVAAAASARQLTLFGVTRPGRTGPWSPRAVCVGAEDAWPPEDEVERRQAPAGRPAVTGLFRHDLFQLSDQPHHSVQPVHDAGRHRPGAGPVPAAQDRRRADRRGPAMGAGLVAAGNLGLAGRSAGKPLSPPVARAIPDRRRDRGAGRQHGQRPRQLVPAL